MIGRKRDVSDRNNTIKHLLLHIQYLLISMVMLGMEVGELHECVRNLEGKEKFFFLFGRST